MRPIAHRGRAGEASDVTHARRVDPTRRAARHGPSAPRDGAAVVADERRARQPAERVGPLERAAARTRVPGGATRIDGDRAAAAREYCGLSRRHLNTRRVAERRSARSGVRK